MQPLIDQLAHELHENWRESMRAAGVESRRAAWDDSEELMVPWPRLSERAKDHNRDMIRAVFRASTELLQSSAVCDTGEMSETKEVK
jgi:thymidylate synthase ThyX